MSIGGALAGVGVLGWAATLSAIDLKCRRLPNVLTISGAVLILAGAAACGRGVPALLGGFALGGLYLAVHLCAPAALGGGDVKLAVALGALTGSLGSPAWIIAALGAPVLTAAVGTVAVLRWRCHVVPHGPSMCAASMVAAAVAVL